MIDEPTAGASRRLRWATLAVLAGGTVFHLLYVACGPLALAPDEAHYWEWSRRLDWSYYSKGPLVAWLIAASTALFGTSELSVRLPAIALGLGTGIFAARLARDLFGDRVALFAVSVMACMPLYSAGSMLMTIDAPLVFCWAGATLALRRALRDGRSRGAWMLCGAALGFGTLAKYTMLFFVPAAALGLLVSPAGRGALRSPGPYLALGIGGLLSLPIVAWNAQHGWVSFRHVGALAGLSTPAELSAARSIELLGSQLGVVSPGIFVGRAGALARWAARGASTRRAEGALLVATSAPLLGFVLLWSLRGKVEANWAAPAYFGLALLLAADWDQRLRSAEPVARRRQRRRIALSLSLGLVLVVVAHFPALLAAAGLGLPARLDPTSRLRGWRELGKAVGGELARDPSLPLVTASYQMASELAFYVAGHPRVYNVNLGRRRNQYDVWGGVEALEGRRVLFVAEGEADVSPSLAPLCGAARLRAVVWLAAPVGRGDPGRAAAVFDCGALHVPLVSPGAFGY